MNKPHSPALQTALAYYDAWRSRDHSTAMNVFAEAQGASERDWRPTAPPSRWTPRPQ